jgi:hypothetical protein
MGNKLGGWDSILVRRKNVSPLHSVQTISAEVSWKIREITLRD